MLPAGCHASHVGRSGRGPVEPTQGGLGRSEQVGYDFVGAERGDESLRPRGWAGKHWSPAIGAEHVACREGVAIFDESSFAKLEVSGAGAPMLLERLCDNEVARDVGRVTYTQMLNSRGGIECDFTVARLAEERFSIVTGTAFGNHDRVWIRRHLPDFRIDYRVDKVRQAIADSWPQSLDDAAARAEWGWSPHFDLPAMTADMLDKLRSKLSA